MKKNTIIIFFTLVIVFFAFIKNPVSGVNCSVTNNADQTISSSCSWVGRTDGNDAGRTVAGIDKGTGISNTAVLSIGNSATLTIPGTQSIAVGSIKITPGGSIIINNGAKIYPGASLWMIDSDGDTYPQNKQYVVFGTTPTPAATVRKNILTTNYDTPDCKDTGTNANQVFINHATCYNDLDLDTYTTAGDKTCLNAAQCVDSTYASAGEAGAVTAYSAGQLKSNANSSDCNDDSTHTNAAQVSVSVAPCWRDEDGDTYTLPAQTNKNCVAAGKTCDNTTYASTADLDNVASYTAGRLKINASGSDCNDNSSANTNAAQVSVSVAPCYADIDGDNYTAAAQTTKNCVAAGKTCSNTTWASTAETNDVTSYTAGRLETSATTDDCCDNNALAYPNEGTYYSGQISGTGCSGWDWDCVGGAVKNPRYGVDATSNQSCTISRPGSSLGITTTNTCGQPISMARCVGYSVDNCTGSTWTNWGKGFYCQASPALSWIITHYADNMQCK